MKKYKIPISYYEEQKPIMEDLMNKSTDKILSLWQHILLVSSSIDGVLISLHSGSPSDLYTRVVFFLTVFVLSFGVSCSAIVLYDIAMLSERARLEFLEEYKKSIQEDRKMGDVYVGYKRRTLFCKKCSYICFGLSLLLLLSYAFLRNFPELIH